MSDVLEEALITIQEDENPPPKSVRTTNKANIIDALRLVKTGFKYSYLFPFALLIAGAIGELILNNYIGVFPSQMYQYICAVDRSGFKLALVKFIAEVVGMAGIVAIKLYTADILAALFRKTIDEKLHTDYMQGNSFYDILIYDSEIDNPDARITQDVTDYSSQLFRITAKVVQVPAQVIWYTILTWRLMDSWTVLYSYLFAAISVFISRIVMHPVMKYTYVLQARNADFRLEHVEVKERAEEVCLSKAQRYEEKTLSEQLRDVLQVQFTLANWSAPLNIAVNIFAYVGSALIYITILLFLKKHPEMDDPVDLTSFASLSSFYVIMLINGFTNIFNMMQDIGKLCGYATRVCEFIAILREHKHRVESASTGDFIQAEHVRIEKPNGTLLIRDLSFVVNRGDSVFISGPSGSGKSSIFRVLGQLWPALEGSLTVPRDDLMILTQTPYIPAGTQIECLAFPKPAETVSAEFIYDALRFVELEHLMDRPSSTWQDGLSPGERQRLALARVFIHKPAFVLLDEATSAIPQKLETAIFERIRTTGIAYMSIAHNPLVKNYHRYSLELDGSGGCSFHEN